MRIRYTEEEKAWWRRNLLSVLVVSFAWYLVFAFYAPVFARWLITGWEILSVSTRETLHEFLGSVSFLPWVAIMFLLANGTRIWHPVTGTDRRVTDLGWVWWHEDKWFWASMGLIQGSMMFLGRWGFVIAVTIMCVLVGFRNRVN